jgi:predicted HTH transcriptional regulator
VFININEGEMANLEDKILKTIKEAGSTGITARQIAMKLGKKREHVSHYLWILKKTGKIVNVSRNLWILNEYSKQKERRRRE